jgi:hypothetical protein
MSKKPAELSAGLVAVKGQALPANDMPGRVADAGNATETGQDPPNFRVSATFRREFKTYAASHDLKLNELLIKCFDSYRKQQRD